MASLALINGSYAEDLSNACFLMATSSSGSITNSHSSVTMARIAPKLEPDSELLRCKRRIQRGQLPVSVSSRGPHPPTAVARRNERERNRVRLVNMGFQTLRQHVPATSKSKKLSKVDTLRSAVEYIKQLQQLLGGDTGGLSADENSYPSGSGASSPTPSVCSEESSAYDVIKEEEDYELMDLASWF